MSLQQELGLLHPFKDKAHEALVNIAFTGTVLSKEGQNLLNLYGLTLAQFNVLLLLKDQSVDGRINQTGLGNMLMVNRSNITSLIDRMVKADLVRRVPDPDDRRVHYIEMTEKGEQVLSNANDAYFGHLAKIVSVLTSDECEQLAEILGRIRKQLTAVNH